MHRIGIVIIGRNEGDRLRGCLESLRDFAGCVVYVDSGSSDGSVALSRTTFGRHAVELDTTAPFTAARARNAGLEFLLKHPQLEYVFFVDGDCEVRPGWIKAAAQFLDAHPRVAVVWGRRREKYPQQSIFNMLCDIEWEGPLGETRACGGDAMMRLAPVRAVNGYRADLICGEEPELCVRLRQAGWQIWRIEEEMTLHDAAMYRFGQWWKRNVRNGYGFAQGVTLHGAPPERHCVMESRRIWLWGLLVPGLVVLASLLVSLWCLLFLLVYPLQVIRLGVAGKRSPRENWWRALTLVGGKFPEVLWQLQFMGDRLRHSQRGLIEYK